MNDEEKNGNSSPEPLSGTSETATAQEKNNAEKSKPNAVKAYLKALPKRYFITAFSGMAQGLFVTLIAGTILAMIAGWCGDNYFGRTLT